jgi:hypothetical protein
MGNIASPCRYDAKASSSLQSSRLRRPAMLHFAFLAGRFTPITGPVRRRRGRRQCAQADVILCGHDCPRSAKLTRPDRFGQFQCSNDRDAGSVGPPDDPRRDGLRAPRSRTRVKKKAAQACLSANVQALTVAAPDLDNRRYWDRRSSLIVPPTRKIRGSRRPRCCKRPPAESPSNMRRST